MFILDGVHRFLITLTRTCEQSDNVTPTCSVLRGGRPLAFHADVLRGSSPAPAPRTFLPPTLSSLEGLLEEPKERLRGRPEGLVSPVPLDLLYSVFKYRPRLKAQ